MLNITSIEILSSVTSIGAEEEWNEITIGSSNSVLPSSIIYYYSEIKIEEEGNYWHYDKNGNIIIW